MTRRRKVLAGLALAAVAAIAGCLDALAPGAPRAFARLGVVPVFDGAANLDGIPADVDSIVVTIHNPPAADIVVAQHIAPGQDSIVITVDVPLVNGVADTVTMGFSAIRSGPPATVLYQGSQEIAVRVGVPSKSDSVRVTYVGPGQNLQSIALSPSSVAVRPGDSVAFNVVSLDSTGATIVGMPVLFQSRNAGVATVTLGGTAHGVAEGRTYVVATSAARSSVRDSALVVVSASPVATISLAPASVTFTATAGGASPASQAVAVTNSGVGALGGLSVSAIQYQATQPTGWLAATLGGTSAPATLTLQASTGSLGAGTYTATVVIASAQAANTPQSVTVTFTVSTGPAIGLSPATVTFTDTISTLDNAAQAVTVSNSGNGTLSGLAVGTVNYGTGPTGWLTAGLNQATAPATLTLSAAKGSLAAGTYTATVPITSGVASNSPQSVTVTFVVVGGPAIGLSSATATFTDTIATPDNAAQTIAVSNSGNATLTGLAVGTINYGTGPTGWLTASLNQATAPAALTLSAAKGALAAGTYTATVPITSGVASNSPRTVTVTFVVVTGPAIGLAATTATFADTLGTSDTAAQTIAVSNSGNATLTGLAVGTINYGTGPTGWLTATLNQATAPATLTLGVAKGSLVAGLYTATVPITSGIASNSPRVVTVTFDLRPVPATLASIQVNPGFAVLVAADSMQLQVAGKDGSGNPMTPTGVRFVSRAPGVVSVDSLTGRLAGVSGGTAVVVASAAGGSGPVYDSLLVAVPASGQAVAYLITNGRSFASARVGDSLGILVGVDLRAVPAERLGSYNAELDWSTAVATFQGIGAVPVNGFVAPTVNTGNTGSGQVRFGAADAAGSTAQPVGLAAIRLMAGASGSSPLTFTLTDLSAAITFTNLLTRAPAALVVSGAVRVQ